MDADRDRTITKSRFLMGRQCLRYLWIAVHEPEKIPPPDEAAKHRFEEGYRIDALAKSLVPDGIEAPHDDFLRNIEETRTLIEKRKPIFEAGFRAGDLAARADILLPAGKDAWDLVEVKSSTEVKDTHLDDVAFQRLCYGRAGLRLRSRFLMHVDSGYVRRGPLEPGKLLVREDVGAVTEGRLPETEAAIAEIRKVLKSKTRPAADIGRHCADPYECPLIDLCRNFPPEGNVFELYRGGEKTIALSERGILALKDIPDGVELSDRQAIQRECARTGKPHVEREEIKKFLDGLRYPLAFLDFETFAPAIPPYDDTSPYRPVPFQFSLHVRTSPGAKPAHRSFLATGDADPRPAFLRALLDALPESGDIVVYNASFEKGVLQNLAALFPGETPWIDGLLARFVDLLQPFRSFHYYHPLQRGSASLKAVLPALTGRGYDGLPVADGLAASRAFIAIASGGLGQEEKAALRRDLETYCGRDTEGMVWIVDALRELVSSAGAGSQ